jgi:hypothetical protein
MAERTETIPEAGPPSLEEVRGWFGWQLDEADGGSVGRIHAVFADSSSGEPTWLIAALERGGIWPGRRKLTLVAVPVRDCAGATGRVWTAHDRASLFSAPGVDPTRPLLQEHEIAICAHYGIDEEHGRAAEVAGRERGSVTSQPVAV